MGNIFTVCQNVKTTYDLTGDSHMMKNTEWGASSYLTESKYGRNGTEVNINDNNSYLTGGGNYTENVLQSTTGNIYGIYDMNGGSYEYVAGVLNNRLSSGTLDWGKFYDFTTINSKYYNTYVSYNESKKIKGDGVYEISGWHQDRQDFPNASGCVWVRDR